MIFSTTKETSAFVVVFLVPARSAMLRYVQDTLSRVLISVG